MKKYLAIFLLPIIFLACDNDNTTNTINATPSSNGLVAYYPFDGNANDQSNNKNNAIVNGAILTSDRFGNVNSAYLFDGTSNYISVPSLPSLTSFGNQITIGGWVKLASYGTQGGILIASGNENEYALAIRPDGKLGVTMVMVNSQANSEFIGKSVIPLNTWTYIAFKYDGLVESIYVNGIIDTSYNTSGAVSDSSITEIISIGAYCWNGHIPYSSFINGEIDDIRIYDRALSDNEIQVLYHENGW